ncbi:MAG: hypothetical protein U0103_24445 [Candidatus Obscuribacterales bacterium]
MTQENVTTSATAAETFGLQQLVIQLKVSRDLGCAVVDNRGNKINGVKLNGANREDLLQAIASQTKFPIVEADVVEMAATLSSASRLNPVKMAFDRALQASQTSRTPALLYIRNFELIGAPQELPELSLLARNELAHAILTELMVLESNDVNNIFVIVSSVADPYVAFTKLGRLPRLDQFCADW